MVSVSSLEYADDVLGGVRITSALTTPTTCFTVPRVGVIITGASFNRSLAKLPVVMYEFLHAVMPDLVDFAYCFPVLGPLSAGEPLCGLKPRSTSSVLSGRLGLDPFVACVDGCPDRIDSDPGGTNAIGMTFDLVPVLAL